MITDIIMPKAGMDMQEGQIVKWMKNVGDKVVRGEILLEIMTDKVNMEVEAEEDGYLLEILYKEGETVPVITTIGYIADSMDEKIPSYSEDIAEDDENNLSKETENDLSLNSDIINTHEYKKNNSGKIFEDDKEIGRVRATPAARKKASDLNINLNEISGTGPNGRIHLGDVENFKSLKFEDLESDIGKTDVNSSPLARRIAELEGIDISHIIGSGHGGKIMKEDVIHYMDNLHEIDASCETEEFINTEGYNPTTRYNKKASYSISNSELGVKEVISMSPMRKAIAKRMSESFYTAPSFTLNTSVDMTNINKLLRLHKDEVKHITDEKMSINDIITFITAKTLKKHDMLNSSLDESGEKIIVHDHVSVAVAVAVDGGLITPVIKNAGEMSLSEIVSETKRLIKKAKKNKLTNSDISGSTITISNLGMFGITHFNPIINQPNSAIIGIGNIVDTPVVIDEEITVRPMMNVSVTLDHRVVDGAVGAVFLNDLKKCLENPSTLFI